MSRTPFRHPNSTLVLAIGAVAYLLWRISTPKEERDREFSIEAGKSYEFTIVAHPFGDYDEWWQGAREALDESHATNVSKIDTYTADSANAVIRFTKTSPVTTSLPMRTVLYPNAPELATATLVEVKPLPAGGVVPLGTSTS